MAAHAAQAKPPLIREPAATAVADVLEAVAELRRAGAALLRLRERRRGKGAVLMAQLEDEAAAEAWVRELTERVGSRARSAGLGEGELLAAAEDVLDGRRRLPAALADGAPA